MTISMKKNCQVSLKKCKRQQCKERKSNQSVWNRWLQSTEKNDFNLRKTINAPNELTSICSKMSWLQRVTTPNVGQRNGSFDQHWETKKLCTYCRFVKIPSNIGWYCIVLYCIVLYCTVLYCVVFKVR